jgi:hypothetical protein
LIAALCLIGLSLATACSGSSSDGASEPGPLVDNTRWMPTEEGEALIGAPPPGAVCELTPIDCDDLYPWPEGECVVLVGSPCVTAYVPECLDNFTVMAVYTRMPNPAEPLCNWLTLAQPSLRKIRAGDEVEIRMRHSALTAPVPNGEARMMFTIGDEVALDYSVLIPSDFQFPSVVWTAPKDYPAGTQILFHVDNHGSNEYMLIEANLL